MQIKKIERTLTDGSKVFDVALRDGTQAIEFGAITEKDADKFIAALADLVEKHTTSSVNSVISVAA
jgi:hypothetical protein